MTEEILANANIVDLDDLNNTDDEDALDIYANGLRPGN